MPDNKLDTTPVDDGKPKKNLLSFKKKKIKNNYSKYSGIIDDNGKPIDNPTVEQSVKTMVNYLKNNTPESNIYRAEHAHTSLLYDKKKKVSNA